MEHGSKKTTKKIKKQKRYVYRNGAQDFISFYSVLQMIDLRNTFDSKKPNALKCLRYNFLLELIFINYFLHVIYLSLIHIFIPYNMGCLLIAFLISYFFTNLSLHSMVTLTVYLTWAFSPE